MQPAGDPWPSPQPYPPFDGVCPAQGRRREREAPEHPSATDYS